MNRTERDGSASCAPAYLAAVKGREDVNLAFGLNLDFARPAIEVGSHADAFDRARRQRLQPDRLPDPDGRGVEDSFGRGGPVLLAARDRLVGQRVLGAHHHDVAAPARDAADVGRERSVAALVARHLLPVDPDRGAVVDRAEMKQEALSLWRAET